MLRLILKWLKAGVSEDSEWSKTTKGTPQGAVMSPLLPILHSDSKGGRLWEDTRQLSVVGGSQEL